MPDTLSVNQLRARLIPWLRAKKPQDVRYWSLSLGGRRFEENDE